MPRSPSRVNTKVQEEERKILKAIKDQPELVELLAADRKKHQQQASYFEEVAKELAEKLNVHNADIVKRMLVKTRSESKRAVSASSVPKPSAALTPAATAVVTSTAAETTMTSTNGGSVETRPKSARSNSSEPRETRRSMRLHQTIEKADSIASTTNTDNSCASSVAGDNGAGDSPTSSIKSQPSISSQQQQLQTFQGRLTRRTLQAINEDDAAQLAAAVADSTQKKQKQQKSKPKQERNASVAAADNDAGEQQNDEVTTTTGKDDDNDEQRQHDERAAAEGDGEEAADLNVTAVAAASGGARNAETSTTPSLASNEPRQTRSLRFSESGRETPRQQRRGAAASAKLQAARGAQKPSPEDSTRVFFESMGLAVMCFPQHVQATVKSQVSSIVLDLEYELNSPGDSKAAAPVA